MRAGLPSGASRGESACSTGRVTHEAAVLPSAFLAAVLGMPVDEVGYERIGGDRGFASTVLLLTIQAHGRPPLTAVAKVGPDPALDREVAFYRVLAGRLAAPAPQCRYAGPAPSLREQLAAEVPREIWLVGERLRDSLETIAAGLRRAPGVAVHGDLHLDNVLFGPEDAGRRPVVLDWGSVCTGPSAIDVFPFLAMSLSPEDHTRHAADLLADLPAGSTSLDDGRRRLLCYFAGVIGNPHPLDPTPSGT
jgi:hypothetical protein